MNGTTTEFGLEAVEKVKNESEFLRLLVVLRKRPFSISAQTQERTNPKRKEVQIQRLRSPAHRD